MYDVENNAEQAGAEQEQECRCGADRQCPFSVWLREAVKARLASQRYDWQTDLTATPEIYTYSKAARHSTACSDWCADLVYAVGLLVPCLTWELPSRFRHAQKQNRGQIKAYCVECTACNLDHRYDEGLNEPRVDQSCNPADSASGLYS